MNNLDIVMIATLPHHTVELNEILLSIQQLESILRLCIKHYQCFPEAVCIARSDGDGYTDPILVSI